MKRAFPQTPKVNTEAVLMKEARTSKPLYANLGDMFSNHSSKNLEHTLSGEWVFTNKNISTTDLPEVITKLERIETNSTGVGMSTKVLVKKFYSVPIEDESDTPYDPGSEDSQHGMGETKGHVILGGMNEYCYDMGFLVLTKKRDEDVYTIANYSYSKKQWLLEPMVSQNLEDFANVDVLGDGKSFEDFRPIIRKMGSSGTYSRTYCDLNSIRNNVNNKDAWFGKLVGYIEEKFSDYLREYKGRKRYEMTFKLQTEITGNSVNAGKIVEEEAVVLRPKEFQIEDQWVSGQILLSSNSLSTSRPFDIKIARRVKDDTDEYKMFNKTKGPDRRMLTPNMFRHLESDITLGNHPCLIIKNKINGSVIDVAKLPNKPNLHRVIMIIETDLKYVVSSADKVRARLKDGNKKLVNEGKISRAAMDFAGEHFKSGTLLKEEEVKNQLEQVLKQEKTINFNQHLELYSDITGKSIDEIDYDEMGEHFRKNLTNENSIPVHGLLDLSDMTTGMIIELKKALPDRDDLNQLSTYILFTPDVKRVNIACISDPNGTPGILDNRLRNSKHGFKNSMLSKYTTEFIQASKVKVEINMIDLRYYGLHKQI